MKCDYYNSALQAVSGLNQSVSGVNSVLRRSVEHHRVSVIWWQMNHRRFLKLSPLSPYTKNTCSDYQIRHHTDNNNNNIAIVFASILAILWWVIALHCIRCRALSFSPPPSSTHFLSCLYTVCLHYQFKKNILCNTIFFFWLLAYFPYFI